jgi:hypothetical protein
MMKAETWLTPDEAVEQGFADCLSKDGTKVKNSIAYDLTMFKHTPIGLQKAKSTPIECGCDCTECEGGDCGSCSNSDCTDEVCDCAATKNNAETVKYAVNEAPATNAAKLDLYFKQLAINKRK